MKDSQLAIRYRDVPDTVLLMVLKSIKEQSFMMIYGSGWKMNRLTLEEMSQERSLIVREIRRRKAVRN